MESLIELVVLLQLIVCIIKGRDCTTDRSIDTPHLLLLLTPCTFLLAVLMECLRVDIFRFVRVYVKLIYTLFH